MRLHILQSSFLEDISNTSCEEDSAAGQDGTWEVSAAVLVKVNQRFGAGVEELIPSLLIIFSMWFAHTTWHGRIKWF